MFQNDLSHATNYLWRYGHCINHTSMYFFMYICTYAISGVYLWCNYFESQFLFDVCLMLWKKKTNAVFKHNHFVCVTVIVRSRFRRDIKSMQRNVEVKVSVWDFRCRSKCKIPTFIAGHFLEKLLVKVCRTWAIMDLTFFFSSAVQTPKKTNVKQTDDIV